MPESLFEYFAVYGPFTVLFVILFYWTLRSYNKREDLYRSEISEMRADHKTEIMALRSESEERSKRHYDILTKFAEKYDIVIAELRELKHRIGRG